MKKMRKLAKHNSSSRFLLSEDIMTEIFLWLPLKSLVRFKRLSKRWHFLISDRNSYFRRNYLSTFSSRRRDRRIVEGGGDDDGDDDDSAIMAGLFYQKPPASEYWKLCDRIRFLPSTSTHSQLTNKYSVLPDISDSQEEEEEEEEEEELEEATTATTSSIVFNPFMSLHGSLDKFLTSCLHLDPDPMVHRKKLLVAGSSNGFLLLSLESMLYDNYYLFNPVTMEWLALPEREAIKYSADLYVGFVCKGDYPSLDLVEYTIVRLSWLEEKQESLRFDLFSNGDNEWSEYRVSSESLHVKFELTGQHNTVIVSTTTTTDNQGGGSRILVYFLVMVWPTRAIAIAVFDLNKGDTSLQMIQTPGPDRGLSVLACADYIREFDDGVIHYVRVFEEEHFEFWVLNTKNGEWYLKHKTISLNRMMRYPWMDIDKWCSACYGLPTEACAPFRIHAFHPMDENLIFLTVYGRIVCYNFKTRRLELVYDFVTGQNIMLDDYCHYVYHWPCWPPLL